MIVVFRSRGRRRYAANRDLAAVMTHGGWRTVAMVLRYPHVDASRPAPGVVKLGAAA